tara:strand:+ start:88 stop:762 length:675 start_codon:yes stop_codon:yes gene_type:complete
MNDVYYTYNSDSAQPHATSFEKLSGSGWDKIVQEDPDSQKLMGRDRNRAFYEPLGFDTHRWVQKLTASYNELGEDSPEHYYNIVVSPLFHSHTDLFAHAGNKIPRILSDWKTALDEVVNAIPLIGTEEFDEILQSKIYQKEYIHLRYQGHVEFHARNLRGWLWVLCARDSIEEVTYKSCEGDCGREVPSPSLPFPKQKNRVLKYCGATCGATVRARRARERKKV